MHRVSTAAMLLIISYTAVLRGQSTNASISGRVADPTEARIVGARIAAINIATNARFEARTNGSGEYQLTNLPPGLYHLEVEKADFKKLIKPDVVVHVQDDLEISFKMALGPASDSVNVEAGAPLLDTTDGRVSTIVNRHFIDNLPLNGRSFQPLIMLAPGVVMTPTAFDDQGQFSVNGQRADANYFTVDGVSANFGVTGYPALVQAAGGALPALSVSGGTNSLVSVDAMQEFRVQTSSFTPEFGRTPGGQVSVVTRSGTNAFHGTLFEYFRNDVLDASDWFVGFNHLQKPEKRQNDFGGVFGGPILKDRTFFFFSYEGLRLRQPSTEETFVPDSASRQQAPAGMHPFLNAYPVQNGPEAGSGLAQFNASYSNPSSLDAYSIRVDHNFNSKINLFGRYNYSPSSVIVRGPVITTPVLSTSESESASIQTFTVGLDQLMTTRISNEIRANYSNDRIGTKFLLDDFGGAVPLTDSLFFPPGYSSANGIFALTITGAGTYQKGKQATDEQRQVNLIDNLSFITGSHQPRFGVDYRWLSPFTSPSSYRQQANFSGVTCSTPPCLKYAISGTAASSVTYAFQSDALLTPNYSLYAQDTWKISPRLTVTYGLRWDVNPALKGKNLANQPLTLTGLNNPPTIALASRGTSFYQTTHGNVAPRIGAAYQLSGSTNWESVLRGGFGIFNDLGYGSLGGASGYFPFFASNVMRSVPFPLSPGNAAPPVLTTNPPVNTIIVADPHLKLPRTYEWNIAFEQSMGKNQILSLTYVGAVGRDLLRETNIAPAPSVNPNFAFIAFTDNSATSDYHALQTKFERRLSQGLQALISYTWSHSIDNASTDAFATYLNTPTFIANPNIDRGNSNFDIRHAFSAGVTYNLLTPKWNHLADAVLGGWSVDSFIFAQSAPPVDVIGGYSLAAGTEIRFRPNVVSSVPLELFGSQYPGGKIFNNTAFTTPPSGHQGDFGRNVLRGFGAFQTDFAVERQFRITEKAGLRFRSEFFNIFNHPNFSPPNNDLTSPLFGHSTQTLASSLGSGGPNGGFSPLYQIGGPRSIQLALKLQF